MLGIWMICGLGTADAGLGIGIQPKGLELKMPHEQKNLIKLLLEFMMSHQTNTFSIGAQDGTPRHNTNDQNRKCLTGRKTLPSFYWIWWGSIRTSFFPVGPRMGFQGATEQKERKNAWRVANTLSSCWWNLWGSIKTALFLLRPRMRSPGIAKGTKIENVWQVNKPYQVLLDFMKSHLDMSFFQ